MARITYQVASMDKSFNGRDWARDRLQFAPPGVRFVFLNGNLFREGVTVLTDRVASTVTVELEEGSDE